MLELPALADEAALYGTDGQAFEVDGVAVPPFTMAVLPDRAAATLRAPAGARIALVGGAPLGPRFMAWNFVSSRKERILQAEADWQALTDAGLQPRADGSGFAPVPGETDFIPLPQRAA